MARTVAGVLREHNGNGVLVLRHGRYENRHVVAACGGDVFEMYAQNYSRRVPDSFFMLNARGIEESTAQGRRMVELGVVPNRILASGNGRGPHTAVCIAQGIANARGDESLMPIQHDFRVDYPMYVYEGLAGAMRQLEETHGEGGSNRLVPEWLNGKRPGQCGESFRAFEVRSQSFVSSNRHAGGLTIVAGHFELVYLLHALYVANELAGEISEDWAPAYNQGVLIVWRDGLVGGYDVAPDLTIIE